MNAEAFYRFNNFIQSAAFDSEGGRTPQGWLRKAPRGIRDPGAPRIGRGGGRAEVGTILQKTDGQKMLWGELLHFRKFCRMHIFANWAFAETYIMMHAHVCILS